MNPPPNPPELIELTTTTESAEQAESLARLLVERRLAACVQIAGPIRSIYRWRGEIQVATEYRLTVKSLAGLARRLTDAIREHHPYETPELLTVAIADASPDYAEWLRAQLDA